MGGIPCNFRQYHAVSCTTIQLQLQTIPCNTKDGAPGCNWAPLNSPQAMFQNPPILRQLWIEAPHLDLKQPLKNLLIFNHLWPRQPLLVDFQGTLKWMILSQFGSIEIPLLVGSKKKPYKKLASSEPPSVQIFAEHYCVHLLWSRPISYVFTICANYKHLHKLSTTYIIANL